MKRLIKRILITVTLIGIPAAIVYGIAIASFSDDPAGKYSSYELFKHDFIDVVRFENGLVTLETCCGDEDFGTYHQDPDGRWVWVWSERSIDERSLGPPTESDYLHTFIIQRKLFGLYIQFESDPDIDLFMKERLFNDFPL